MKINYILSNRNKPKEEINMEFKFPVYLQWKENIFKVLGFIGEVDNYIEDKGYIDRESGVIYIFSNEKRKTKENVAYFWFKDDKLKFSDITPTTKKNICVDKIIEWDFDKMVENSDENEELYNEEAINDMNAATEVFVPIINEGDDFLKKIIKTTIIEKGIDIKRLQHRLDKKYGLINMKSALIGKTKMSVPNFIVWAELLGIDWEITIIDNGTDKINPLKESLVYKSSTDRITKGI